MSDQNPLPLEKMAEIRDDLRQSFRNAKPFPHIVVDNFFDEQLLERILEVFPASGDPMWKRFDEDRQIKLASSHDEEIPVLIRSFLYFLNSATFVEWLEDVTGIDGLMPDPWFDGGGLHQILPGGKLAIHVDFNKQKRFNLDRRLNVLLYLNKSWQEAYGGACEFWNKDMTVCEKKILPIFGRLVVFETTDTSWHGHPDPLTCPEGVSRKSLALYYFTMGRPELEKGPTHTTIFRPRPHERGALSSRLRAIVEDWLPPVVMRALSKMRTGRQSTVTDTEPE